jgi:hypothetical protein
MTSYSNIFELHKHLSLNIRTILLFWPFHIEHDEMADHEDCHLFPITTPVNCHDVAHSRVILDHLIMVLLRHSHCHEIFERIKTKIHCEKFEFQYYETSITSRCPTDCISSLYLCRINGVLCLAIMNAIYELDRAITNLVRSGLYTESTIHNCILHTALEVKATYRFQQYIFPTCLSLIDGNHRHVSVLVKEYINSNPEFVGSNSFDGYKLTVQGTKKTKQIPLMKSRLQLCMNTTT